MISHFVTRFKTDFTKIDKKINFLDRRGCYSSFDYQQLWDDSLVTAQALAMIGIKRKSLVLIVFDTSYEYLKTFIAIQILNATAVSIYPPSTIENKKSWLKKSKMQVLYF